MTYGLCADMHAHAWSLFSTLVDDDGDMVNSRLKGIMDEFDRLCAATRIAGGSRVYIAGDVFHVRGNLRTSVLNYVMIRMRRAARQNDVQVRIMPGNHDLEDSEVTWLGNATMMLDDAGDHGFDEHLIQIVQEPQFFEDDMVAVVPWQNTRAGLEQSIKEITDTINVCGHHPDQVDLHLHTGINGVIVGMPDHGWSPAELAGFGFHRVFAGHYHNHKVFNVPRPGSMGDAQIVSIGALTHQTWGDVNTDAGWLIVDGHAFDFNETKQPKFMDFGQTADISEFTGNYVRVRDVELDEQEIRDLKDALTDAGALGVVVQTVPKNKVVTRNGATPGKTVKVETSISDWIEQAEIENSEAVEKAALDVLSEARSVA